MHEPETEPEAAPERVDLFRIIVEDADKKAFGLPEEATLQLTVCCTPRHDVRCAAGRYAEKVKFALSLGDKVATTAAPFLKHITDELEPYVDDIESATEEAFGPLAFVNPMAVAVTAAKLLLAARNRPAPRYAFDLQPDNKEPSV